jgi:non-homologous end joining protein Ku
VVETPQPHVAPVIDIMEALKKSLADRKQPERARAATAESPIEEPEEAAGEPAAKKRTARKRKVS